VTASSLHLPITLFDAVRIPEGSTSEHVQLNTDRGSITCGLHPAASNNGILWVFGAGGGLGGPAGGHYTRLAGQFQPSGVASLELDYRRPGYLQDCVIDVLVGLAYLGSLGVKRIVLVGHSFGGAVVINAGEISESVIAVAALSSQTAGTEAVRRLSPKPVLLIHGEKDEVLSPSCSIDLHMRAHEPKELILYPDCLHGLDQCQDVLDRDLTRWLREAIGLV